MKKLVVRFPVVINVEVEVYHPLLLLDFDDSEVVAAVDPSNLKLPNGRVIAKEKARITQQMEDDFESFMTTVEDFCEDNCGLVGTYKNVSPDNSYYYNYLAKDDEGNIIIDYRFRLRVSNHPASRNSTQQYNKKAETQSELLHKLLTDEEISKLKVYFRSVTVNDTGYNSYEDAMEDIFDTISTAVKVMKSNEKYRPKKKIED